jgi:hypothetical protein
MRGLNDIELSEDLMIGCSQARDWLCSGKKCRSDDQRSRVGVPGGEMPV